ncbi:MAG: hypothetical protein ACWGSQ_17135 [Longimicrobiales bacterium]
MEDQIQMVGEGTQVLEIQKVVLPVIPVVVDPTTVGVNEIGDLRNPGMVGVDGVDLEVVQGDSGPGSRQIAVIRVLPRLPSEDVLDVLNLPLPLKDTGISVVGVGVADEDVDL